MHASPRSDHSCGSWNTSTAAAGADRPNSAIPMERYEQKLVRHLSMEEVRAILNAPDIGTRLGIRDRAMIHLCFGGGLRVSELVGATLSNLVLGAVPSLLVNGKGRKHRNFPLWKETASDLRMAPVRGDARAPEIFVNAEGRAMTRSGFEYILDKHAAKAALRCPSLAGRSISPHQLRHSCAVIMLEATRDIRKVALWLGHADIRTTEIYLRVERGSEARSCRGGHTARTAPREVQGSRCTDRDADSGESPPTR